ncbi:MAG: EscU/YscU/HrcU family type III secretion system export apparatus switch protein [Anaerolineales bacterium]|nr:EscU/YscU/HrcU family type III secretion system export apparatus switch protein [Anaerolineales bacterium]
MAAENSSPPSGKQKTERQKAVALGYDPGLDSAPRVLAGGAGKTAERIIQLAEEHGIVIQEDPLLVEALSQVELGSVIPPELYRIVAEIFAYVYRIQDRI